MYTCTTCIIFCYQNQTIIREDKTLKKVFILQNGEYIELSYQKFQELEAKNKKFARPCSQKHNGVVVAEEYPRV